MKQKVIIEVSVMKDQNSRRKVFRTVVSQYGVISATVHGEYKNQIEVVGEGVDACQLTAALRKKLGCCELVSVSEVKDEKKDEKKNPEDTAQNPNWSLYHYGMPMPHLQVFEVRDHHNYNPNVCSVM